MIDKVWVVVAWKNDVMVPVPGTGAPDLGRMPDLQPEPQPRAVVWLRCATKEAEAAAADARRRVQGQVFIYPDDVGDPLKRARCDIMEKNATQA